VRRDERSRSRTVLAVCAIGALSFVACVRPRQPTVTPIALTVLGVQSTGMQLQLDLSVYNPNRIGFTVRAVTARVTVMGRDLGTVQQAANLRLSARRSASVSTQLVVPWGDLPGLLLTGVFQPQVPYHLDGTVAVAGPAGVSFDVRFQMDGGLPRAMLLQTPLNTLQQLPFGGLWPFGPATTPATPPP